MTFSPLATLIGILSLLIAVPVLISATKWWIRRYAEGKSSKAYAAGEYSQLKKYPWVDVLSNTTTARLLGMSFSLGLIVVLMNFTVYEKPAEQQVFNMIIDDEIEIEPPRTAEPPPPPPPAPPPIISEVPNEEIREEDQPEFEDMTVEEETFFEEALRPTPPPTKEEDVAPPPPPPPPPPMEEEVAEIFKVVEKMPLFGGCQDKACSDRAVITYIQSNIVYPVIAKENGVSGRVIVQFVVEPTGKVSNVRVLRDIGAGCGDAAAKVIMDMNNLTQGWTPGEQRNKPVRVLYTIPAKFEILS